jgi:EAL domain-containing protein (putative c-di-GMP-specific phosphodiesterase class I)
MGSHPLKTLSALALLSGSSPLNRLFGELHFRFGQLGLIEDAASLESALQIRPPSLLLLPLGSEAQLDFALAMAARFAGMQVVGFSDGLSVEGYLRAAESQLAWVDPCGGIQAVTDDLARVIQKPIASVLQRVPAAQEIEPTLLTQGEIRSVFQPIVSNKSGAVEHYECLARLQHNRQLYTPAHFMQAAKEGGLLSAITDAVMRQGIGRLKNASGGVSVNLFIEDLYREDLDGLLKAHCEQLGIATSRVTLEIPKGALREKAPLIAAATRLKKAGFKIALDNFSGQAGALKTLLDLEVDFVKLDGALTHHSIHSASVADQIGDLADFVRTLGGHTIAEHVSSQALHQSITDLGVDYAQGFHIGRPDKGD